CEPLVEQAPGRTDERRSLSVLFVTRLLADQEKAGRGRPRAEDRLRGPLPQRARTTVSGRGAQALEPGARRRHHYGTTKRRAVPGSAAPAPARPRPRPGCG